MAGNGDFRDNFTEWFEDEILAGDGPRRVPCSQSEVNTSGYKVIELQRKLQEQTLFTERLQQRVKELEVELTLSRQKLLYQKSPSNAELWQQLTTQRVLVKELENRCARLNREARRTQTICKGQGELLADDLNEMYIKNCANSTRNTEMNSLPLKNQDTDKLKETILQLENEIHNLKTDNLKDVTINMKLYKRIDSLDGRIRELLKQLDVEKERNSFLQRKLDNVEVERRAEITRLHVQLQQAVRALQRLGDRQSKTSMGRSLSHLLSKLRPSSSRRSKAAGDRKDRHPKQKSKERR